MKKQSKKIEVLRKSLAMSNAAFTTSDSIGKIFSILPSTRYSTLKILYKLALDEISEPKPNIKIIDYLISQISK
jgi:hypothetical protein